MNDTDTQSDAFAHFPDGAVAFLRDLESRNTREYFSEQKVRYERDLRDPSRIFASALANEITTLTGVEHQHKIFRIHRDLRFSKDKTPYHTHLHMSFTPVNGRKDGCFGWYFGLDPKRLSLGVGVFSFPPPLLTRYREKVAGAEGEALAATLAGLRDIGAELSLPELRKVPKGFDRAHPREGLLKHKSLHAWRQYSLWDLPHGFSLVGFCLGGLAPLKPLHDWMTAHL